MAPRVSIKSLQDEVANLQITLEESEANRILAETSLAEARATIQQQEAALTEARARAEQAGNANMDGNEAAQINKPSPITKGGRIPIQEAMGLGGKDELYVSIQKYIHTLVPACAIDWKQDFRLQSADNLAKLYRAARKEYPILKCFKNDWATAELLKMYLQNSREHARARGYLPRASRKAAARTVQTTNARRANDENIPPQGRASSSSTRRRGRGSA